MRVVLAPNIKPNLVINTGYSDGEKLFPHNPRLAFDQMATII